MKKYHLIGQNIGTSLSPIIHNSLFKLKNFKGEYTLYQQNKKITLNEIVKLKIQGLSITIPFKQSYKEEKDLTPVIRNFHQKAQKILENRKIINTIRFDRCSQKFQSANTDIFGVKRCLQNYMEILKDSQNSQTAILIGGGATSEVFLAYLTQKNIPTIVLNRSLQRIQKLKQFYPIITSIHPLINVQQKVQENPTQQQIIKRQKNDINNIIVINTLPTNILKQNLLQNKQNKIFKNLMKNLLNSKQVNKIGYMDVNYRDKENILKQIIIKNVNQNLQTINQLSNGLDMLIWQAIQQNRLFCCQDLQLKQITEQINKNQFFYVKKILEI